MANVNDTIKTASGIAIHFHGLSMWDNATWADGTSYVTQCPLQPGSSFTYSFQADESPGTYFWHDHSTMNRANGLQGALILAFPRVTPPIVSPYPPVTAEFTMLLSDWWDMEANAMGMRLNRAADATPTDDTLEFTNGCVDLNSGQRYDVLLTATARVPSNFWISVHSQYRQGAPSAYAVLRYAAAPANTLPSTPTPQAFVQPWDHYQINNVLNMTSPLLNATGQLRWAMNNIAMPTNPPW
ncbi:uncharacterized protein HaLaN_23702, partial [Haematococcus lacustris]